MNGPRNFLHNQCKTEAEMFEPRCKNSQKKFDGLEDKRKDLGCKNAPPPPKFDPKECKSEEQIMHTEHNIRFQLDRKMCPNWNACKDRLQRINEN